MGIIQSIIWLWDCCCGSVLCTVVIFCCTHIEAPTRRGKIINLSGEDRSSQRNRLSRGTREKPSDQEE